jgi:hypothetical protein
LAKLSAELSHDVSHDHTVSKASIFSGASLSGCG